MRGVLLHSISDLSDAVENGLHRGGILFSTHPNVDAYAKELYGVECKYLGNYLTLEEILEHSRFVSNTVDKLLLELDARIAPGLNSTLGCRMRYLTPLYSYIGKHHLLGYSCLEHALNKVIENYSLSELTSYHLKGTSLVRKIHLGNFLDDLSSIRVETLESKQADAENHLKIQDRLKYACAKLQIDSRRNLRNLLRRIFDQPGTRRVSGRDRATIFVSGSLFDLEIIIDDLKSRYELFYFENGAPSEDHEGWGLSTPLRLEAIRTDMLNNIGNVSVKAFLRDMLDDFSRNIHKYIQELQCVIGRHRKTGISLGLWGNPPMSGPSSLAFEYLRSEGIKTIGLQHGASYGDQVVPLDLDLDYRRCDFFISYGFTGEDLQRGYRDNVKIPADLEILPFGKLSNRKNNSGKLKDIDILFPVTNSVSLFDGGLSRNPFLTQMQIDILEYLNTKQGLSIIIKPMLFSTHRNSVIFPFLSRCRNLKIINYLTLRDFLIRHSPRAVVIEYPSTTLYDIIDTDTEIFLLGDPINVYEEEALTKLTRRVHFAESTEELFLLMDRFLHGNLGKKRDRSFSDHYLRRDHAREKVMDFINTLLHDSPNLN